MEVAQTSPLIDKPERRPPASGEVGEARQQEDGRGERVSRQSCDRWLVTAATRLGRSGSAPDHRATPFIA